MSYLIDTDIVSAHLKYLEDFGLVGEINRYRVNSSISPVLKILAFADEPPHPSPISR
jgi:hypothetical protein